MNIKTTVGSATLSLSIVYFSMTFQAYGQDNFLDDIPKATPENWDSAYPAWKTGVIDYIDEDIFIVDDIRYILSDTVSLYRLNGNEADIDSFSERTVVTMVLAPTDRQTVEILVLGELKEQSEEP